MAEEQAKPVQITGQHKPLEVEFEWKTSRVLENIQNAVDQIQAAVGDSWAKTGPAASPAAGGVTDMDMLAEIMQKALAESLREAVLDIRAAMQVDSKPEAKVDSEALASAITQAMPEQPAAAPDPPAPATDEATILAGLKQTAKVIKWNHDVLTTDAPPTEAMLDKMGVKGYELINVIYEPTSQKWISYFKKLMLV